MRVNVEDEVHGVALAAVARALSVEEDTALGRLTIAWRETQRRKLAWVTEAEFRDALKLRVVGDPRALLDAMVAADFATFDSGRWFLRGNDKHIERLETYQDRARKGGIARQLKAGSKQAQSKPKAKQEARRQASSNEPAASPPMLLYSTTDHDLQISDPALIPSHRSEDPQRSATTSKNEVAAQSPTARIRAAYLDGYRRKFGRDYAGWGARANGQATQLQRDWPAERIVELVGLFFDWNNPRAIAAGYPFGFFATAIHELDTDTHAPERKRIARTLDAAERQVGNEDAEKIKFDLEMRQLRAKREAEENHLRTSGAGAKRQDAPLERVLGPLAIGGAS